MDSSQLKLNDLRKKGTAVYYNDLNSGIRFYPDGIGKVDRVEIDYSRATISLIWGWEKNSKVRLWIKNEWLLDNRNFTMYGYNDYGLSNLVGKDEYEDFCLDDPCTMMRSTIKNDNANPSNIMTSIEDSSEKFGWELGLNLLAPLSPSTKYLSAAIIGGSHFFAG
jgi:hypothetical protein